MAELKTQKNKASVKQFLDSVEDEGRREDARQVLAMMEELTGEKPAMWGPSIVGFGSYSYKTTDGKRHDWFMTGFSPRKTSLTLYIMDGFDGYKDLMDKLGKHTTGKSCLYIKRLSDVDTTVLRKLMKQSIDHVRKHYSEAKDPRGLPKDA